MSLKIDRVQLEIIINSDPARQQLAKLDQQAAELRKQLRKLPEGTAEYIAKSKELKEVVAQHDKIIEKMGLTSLTMKELQRRATELKNILRNLDPNTAQFKELDTQLKAVSTRMNELRGINTQTGISISKIAEGINRYIGLITVAAASLTGMVMGVRKTIDAYTEWDDKLADVMKTTGLTKDEVKGLNTEISKINTRTSQMELLDLARVAGKLGITGQDEIAGFVRAANQIKVALTEDLGGDVEESVNQLGKLTEIFKLKDEFGTERALLKVGSAINSLGAASTANEAFMVEFAKRVAGVAPQADISIQKVLGLAATLDQLGQTSEVSSTVFAAVIPDMFKDTSKYAEIAGMSVNQFSRLLSVDANAAFIAFLKGLNGNNSGLGEMAEKLDGLGLEGKRSISVLGVLAANTDLLTQTQQMANTEFAKGTSLTQEYLVKNNTAQAELEKARKGFQAMAVELGEKLAPAMTFSTSGLSYFLKALKLTIEFVSNHLAGITSLAVAIAAYTIVVNLKTIATKLSIDWDIISLKYLYAKETATKALAFAKGVLTGQINLATAAQKAWNLVSSMSLGGIGLLVGAIAAATTYFIAHGNSVKEAGRWYTLFNEIAKEKRDQISQEKVETEGLIKQAILANEGSSLRIKLINEIISKYPSLLSSVKAEAITNDQLTASLTKLNAVSRERYRMVAFEAKKEATEKLAIEANTRLIEIEEELRQYRENTTFDEGVKERGMKLLTEESARLEKQIGIWQKQISNYASAAETINNNIDAQYGTTIESLIKRRTLLEGEIAKMRAQFDLAILPQQQNSLGIDIGEKLHQIDLINILLAPKEQKPSKNKKITTDNDVTVTNGKVDPADKKAMLEAKKAENKAWADLEKILDKELEADGQEGQKQTGNNLNKELSKEAADKKEKDALVANQTEFANTMRDSAWALAQEEIEAEKKVAEFKKLAAEAALQAKQRQFDAAFQSLENIKSIFGEETIAFKTAAVGQAVMNTYSGAAAALAPPPVGAGPLFGPILAATTIALGLANVAKIVGVQFAEGRYPVTGASDGRTYNAAYQSTPRTGLYSKPTLVGGLGLVGERGSEIVISHPHVRHLQMNYPEVIRTIYNTSGRVPQFAQGNYPAATRTPGTGAAPANEAKGKEEIMIALLQKIANATERPTRAFVTYNDLNDTVNEVSTVENSLK